MNRPGRVTPFQPGRGGLDVRWKRDAACAPDAAAGSFYPDLFFPDWGESTRDAKRVCYGCPVIQACLRYALAAGEEWGVWGGLSAPERRRLKKRHQAA